MAVFVSTYFPNDGFIPPKPFYSDVSTEIPLKHADNLIMGHAPEQSMVAVLPATPRDFAVIKITDHGLGCTALSNKLVKRHPSSTHTINFLADDVYLDLPGKIYIFSFYNNNWQVSI